MVFHRVNSLASLGMRPTGEPQINGPALRAIREAAKIPAAKMAADLGLSRPYLSMIESGQRGCRAALIRDMARYLSVPPMAICTYSDVVA